MDVQVTDEQKAALAAFEHLTKEFSALKRLISQGRFGGRERIGIRIGRGIDKYQMAKHIELDIRDDGFDFHQNEESIREEASLDGLYVVRTSTDAAKLSDSDVVRSYKSLSQVERAFRSLKTIDLKVRPINHHLEARVRTHIFLCMLAYYVEWHLREAWRPLLFEDEEQEAKKPRDPVAPARRSDSALEKTYTHALPDGTQVHSFDTLLSHLGMLVRNVCTVRGSSSDRPLIEIFTTPDPTQKRALELVDSIRL